MDQVLGYQTLSGQGEDENQGKKMRQEEPVVWNGWCSRRGVWKVFQRGGKNQLCQVLLTR